MITRKWVAATVLGFAVGALALTTAAHADHNPAVGGQFCGADHEGDVHQSTEGDWYVCEEQGDDTQPRWYPTSEPEPEPTATAEPTEEPTAAPTEEPTEAPPANDDEDPADGEGAGLPETGAPTGLIVGGALGLAAVGGGLFLVARRRRVSFTA